MQVVTEAVNHGTILTAKGFESWNDSGGGDVLVFSDLPDNSLKLTHDYFLIVTSEKEIQPKWEATVDGRWDHQINSAILLLEDLDKVSIIFHISSLIPSGSIISSKHKDSHIWLVKLCSNILEFRLFVVW